MDTQNLDELRSVDELRAYQREVTGRITALHNESAGRPFGDEARDEFATLRDTNDEIGKRVAELEAREKYVRTIANTGSVERESDGFREARTTTRKESDIFDLSSIRIDPTNPEKARQEYRDRAMKALEVSVFPQATAYGTSNENLRGHVANLLDTIDSEDGALARRILTTGSPAYRRAFMKHLAGKPLSNEEQRAFSTGSTGIPIPYQLDPTILPTSNGSVNPFRAICSVEQISVKEWRGTTSGAVTAAYAAEGTEASDNTPTLAQPTVPAERAQVFIPYSVEAGADWGSMQAEMARLIADSKDDLESNKFFSGSGTNEPTGLNAMTTGADTATASVGAFVIGDLFTLENSLAPRFRSRASLVANRAQYNRIRQFDTSGGAGLWLYVNQALNNDGPTPGRTGASVLGYPAYESSQMLSVLTTGSRILLLGDFKYYKIVDRVGMDIEVIPHLFGATNRYPTGQRAVYAVWRNGGKTLSEAAFKFLKT